MSSFPVFVASYVDPAALPLRDTDHLLVCVGRSNVGKSSLVNVLAGQAISRTSGTPGRTRLINLFRLATDRALVDLPGYGYAKQAKKEREGLESMIHETLLAVRGRPGLKVLLVSDAAVGLTALDEETLAFLRTEGLPFAVVANKADVLNQRDRSAQEKAYGARLSAEERAFFCSTKSGLGLPALRDWLQAQ